MKKVYKRSITVILAVIIIFSCFSATSFAVTTPPTSQNGIFTYCGFAFQNIPEDSVAGLKEAIDAALLKLLKPNSYFAGLNPDAVYKTLQVTVPKFAQYFVSYNKDEFRRESYMFIKEQYEECVVSAVDYDWYFSQLGTGLYQYQNCVCACLAMALKWYNKDVRTSVENVAHETNNKTGLSAYEALDYLRKFNIIHKTVRSNYGDFAPLLCELTEDSILLVYVRGEFSNRMPLPEINTYPTWHGIIINGYFKYNGVEYVTIYDPAGFCVRANDDINKYSTENCDIDIRKMYQNYNICKLDELTPYLSGGYNIAIKRPAQVPTTVPLDHWGYSAISYLYNNGVFDNAEFQPDALLTRGDLVKYLAIATSDSNLDFHASRISRFKDVPEDSLYKGFLNWAYSIRIINGYEGKKFYPNNNISREEVCTIIARYLYVYPKLDSKKNTAVSFVDQNKIEDWATEHVHNLAKGNLIKGFPVANGDVAFMPKKEITNAEISMILYRILS